MRPLRPLLPVPLLTRLSRDRSGICATINIICMMALQVPTENVKLYDDSLSGWVRDPALPMEPMAKL